MAEKTKQRSDWKVVLRRIITSFYRLRTRLEFVRVLVLDNRIPTWQKVIPFLPLVYILSPFNFLSFAIPFLGQVDDIMLLFAAFDLFERLVDDAILEEYRKELIEHP